MIEMTPRECFRAAMHFRKADRLPWYESVGDDVVLRWIREGLPLEKALSEPTYELWGGGVGLVSVPAKRTFDVSSYFGFTGILSHPLAIDLGPLPRFYPKILDQGERWKVHVTEHGVTQKLFLDRGYAMPQFLDFPVKTKKDWEEYRKRLDPTDIRRYPKAWGDEFIEYCKNSTTPIGLIMHGFYALGRELMGTVPFITTFYKDPELVSQMMDYHAEFLVEVFREAVETLRSNIDFVFWHEDMAYKNGPVISPKIFREFMLPGYKKVTDFFHRNQIDTIILDCDGDITLLLPLILEGGINGTSPLEVTAGMDALSLRKKYGRSLMLWGNIDKRVLESGDKDSIRREVESKVPYFKEEGGYLVRLDHVVPPDISLETFQYYVNVIKEYL